MHFKFTNARFQFNSFIGTQLFTVEGCIQPNCGKNCCLLQNVTRLSVRCPTLSMREAVIKVTDPDMVAVMLRDIFIPAQDGVQNVQMVGWLK